MDGVEGQPPRDMHLDVTFILNLHTAQSGHVLKSRFNAPNPQLARWICTTVLAASRLGRWERSRLLPHLVLYSRLHMGAA